MKKLITSLQKKINHSVWVLVIVGIIFLLLAIIIVWTDLILRLGVGLVVLCIAGVFFYGAYRIYTIKADLENFFKIK